MQEFAEYQKLAYKTMDQVRRLLSDVTVAKDNKDIYLMGGHLTSMAAQNANKETLERVQDILEAQGERQQELLEEMTKISGNFPKQHRKANSVYLNKRRGTCAKENQRTADLMFGVLILT